MSSQHFKNNNPKVGLTLWVGDLSQRPIEKYCIINNSRYFDKFYLITDRDQKLTNLESKDIKLLIDPDICEIISDLTQYNLHIETPYPFAANYVSDILTYFPKSILNKLTGNNYEAVMYLDSDYLVYSKFTLHELFNYFTNQEFYLLRDTNFYCRYPYEDYVNSCWSLDSSTVEQDNIKWIALHDQVKEHPFDSYSAIGPCFTNSDKIYRFAKIAPLKSHAFDPRIIHAGKNSTEMRPGALGCHLVSSIPKEVGFVATEVKMTDNRFIDMYFDEYSE